MSGLNRMLGELYWLSLPKITGRTAGIPTNRLIPVTSLAVVLVFGILRNRNRSKIRPRAGARITTERTKASQNGQVLVLDQQGEDEGRDVGLGPEGEVEHAGGLVREYQAHRHDGVGAPIGNAGDGETQEVLHSGAGPYSSPAGAGSCARGAGRCRHRLGFLAFGPHRRRPACPSRDRDELGPWTCTKALQVGIGGGGVGGRPVGDGGESTGREVGELVGDVDDVGLGQVVAGRLDPAASRTADCQPWRATPL